jgi:release factor glutamine methyltransferase
MGTPAPRRWELLEDVAARLDAAGVPRPEVDARWLVDAMVERFGPDLVGCDAAVLDALVARRAAREPLQLVLGRTTFRWVEVACRPGVFVPRPETEVVAGVAIDAARTAGPAPRVLEPCTGSGAIACAVASEVPRAQVVATDHAAAAVDLARDNAARLAAGIAPTPWRPGPWPAPGAGVEVRHGRLLAAAPATWQGAVDVLVANPPYLPEHDTGTWAPEVGDHDPHDALVGGRDGHEVVDALLAAAPTWLRPGGTAVVEIDDRRGPDAVAVATGAGLVEVHVVQDLTGRDRAVVGRTPGHPRRPTAAGVTT